MCRHELCEARNDGTKLSGSPPWQWPVWWENTLAIGEEMGAPFGQGLLRASSVTSGSLDLTHKLPPPKSGGGDRVTSLRAVRQLMVGLTSLILKSNFLDAAAGEVLADGLQHSPLTSLDLSVNNLGCTGVTAIANAVPSKLTTLNLKDTNLLSTGLASILSSLLASVSLTSLNLSWNNLGDDGGKCIADALSIHSSGLQVLDLELTGLRRASSNAIAKALQTHKSLLRLNMKDNDIEQPSWDRLPWRQLGRQHFERL